MAWSYDYQEHKFYHVPNNVPTRSTSSNFPALTDWLHGYSDLLTVFMFTLFIFFLSFSFHYYSSFLTFSVFFLF